MQRQYDFESDMKGAMEEECRMLHVSPDLKNRIDEQILRSQKEVGSMKHLSAKKAVIGIAAACLLIGGTAFAAAGRLSFTTHTYMDDAYKSYSDMEQAQEELGYAVDSVEEFSNGYRFHNMFVTDVEAADEGGNPAYSFKEMEISYEKKGTDADIMLTMYKPVEEEYVEETGAGVTRDCNGITLYYSCYTNKVVPPDYKLTAEDEENLAGGNYNIAYGSDKVEVQQSSHVKWTKNGILYMLMGFDLGMSPDEMFDMAEEIIGQQ